MEIMYTNVLSNHYFETKKFLSFMGDIKDLKLLVDEIKEVNFDKSKTVKSYLPQADDYLKALGLKLTILEVKIGELASTDLKLIKLIKAILLKPKLIILNNVDIGINDRVNNRISRFIRTMNDSFNIKFLVISNNPVFLNMINRNVLIMKDGIIKYQGDLIIAIKQKIIPKPPIIKMIDLIESQKIDYTLDDKELLKAIYRSVE